MFQYRHHTDSEDTTMLQYTHHTDSEDTAILQYRNHTLTEQSITVLKFTAVLQCKITLTM